MSDCCTLSDCRRLLLPRSLSVSHLSSQTTVPTLASASPPPPTSATSPAPAFAHELTSPQKETHSAPGSVPSNAPEILFDAIHAHRYSVLGTEAVAFDPSLAWHSIVWPRRQRPKGRQIVQRQGQVASLRYQWYLHSLLSLYTFTHSITYSHPQYPPLPLRRCSPLDLFMSSLAETVMLSSSGECNQPTVLQAMHTGTDTAMVFPFSFACCLQASGVQQEGCLGVVVAGNAPSEEARLRPIG